MALLESFMARPSQKLSSRPRFVEGQVTVVDLSDPFIDAASACGIFDVVVRLFVRAKVDMRRCW